MTGDELLIIMSMIMFIIIILAKMLNVMTLNGLYDNHFVWISLAAGLICSSFVFIASLTDPEYMLYNIMMTMNQYLFGIFIALTCAEVFIMIGVTSRGRYLNKTR